MSHTQNVNPRSNGQGVWDRGGVHPRSQVRQESTMYMVVPGPISKEQGQNASW